MKVAVISANLGSYDQPADWPVLDLPHPSVTVDVHRFDDRNFPPRPLAMTSRLQCGLLKWFGPDFVPGADAYLWIDASCAPTCDAIRWFLIHLSAGRSRRGLIKFRAEMALFRHPDRQTIRQEYEFIVKRMQRPGETYLTGRYKGEWLEEQFAAIESAGYADAPLFASTAFMYRPTPRVRNAMKETWFGKTRYHLHDQLWFAYVVAKSGVRVSVIDANYLECSGLTFMRRRRR